MGGGRSLLKLTENYTVKWPDDGTKPPTRYLQKLKLWSSKYHWQDRLARLLEIRNAHREAVRLQRLEALEDDDWQLGEALKAKVLELLEELEKFQTETVSETVGEDGEIVRTIIKRYKPALSHISQSAKIASELQRWSTGAATQNNRLVDRQGNDRDLPVMGIEIMPPVTVPPTVHPAED